MPQALHDNTGSPSIWARAEAMLPSEKQKAPASESRRPSVSSSARSKRSTSGQNRAAMPASPRPAATSVRGDARRPRNRRPFTMFSTPVMENTTASRPEVRKAAARSKKSKLKETMHNPIAASTTRVRQTKRQRERGVSAQTKTNAEEKD